LPVIQNVKTVDPRKQESPQVIQLERREGAAIESFGIRARLCPTLALRAGKDHLGTMALRSMLTM